MEKEEKRSHLQELKQKRAKYGGFSFDTPDKNLLKRACKELWLNIKEVVSNLNLEHDSTNEILADDVIKIICSSNEKIGIIAILNRNTGECLMKEKYKKDDFIVETLRTRFTNRYEKFLTIIPLLVTF